MEKAQISLPRFSFYHCLHASKLIFHDAFPCFHITGFASSALDVCSSSSDFELTSAGRPRLRNSSSYLLQCMLHVSQGSTKSDTI